MRRLRSVNRKGRKVEREAANDRGYDLWVRSVTRWEKGGRMGKDFLKYRKMRE